MNLKLSLFSLVFAIGSIAFSSTIGKPVKKANIAFIKSQTKLLISEVEARIPPFNSIGAFCDQEYSIGPLASPRSIRNEKLFMVPSRDWTSGFFPGNLWFLYEITGEEFWKQKASEFTARIEREKLNDMTHDMGFKINCSYGNGYRITGDQAYKEIIVQSAQTLMRRYSPIVGATLSWGNVREWGTSLTTAEKESKWLFPVIIDNMMNLELLFLATHFTGDSSFYHAAVQHAKTTIKNHFREDNSSYHVVDFNPITGEVRNLHTHQGAAHESAWARGQAWGLYGFTLCFRETSHPEFLLQAEKIATYILNHPHMPKDLVPYWDFDAPNIPDEPKDVSAAALIASALYELSTFIPEKSLLYRQKADKILISLQKKYSSKPGTNYGFILEHSTGHLPGNHEIDEPLIYADYYYLEALLRKQKIDL